MEASLIFWSVWEILQKYEKVRLESIYPKRVYVRFWRKSDILLITQNVDIKNDIGSASTSIIHEIIDDTQAEELCSLPCTLKLKTEEYCIDTISEVGRVFADLFVTDRNTTDDDFKTLENAWVCVEDDLDVIDDMIDTENETPDEVNTATVEIADGDSEKNDSADVKMSMMLLVTMDQVTKELESLKLYHS